MRIERIDTGVEPVFRLVGRLEGLACRHLVRMLTGPVCDGGVVTVELDELETCDARGTDALVSLTKRARDAGGTLVLNAPTETVLREFESAGALSNLQIASDDGDTSEPRPDDRGALRYLTRVGEEQPFAYEARRRDFYLLSDDTLWAHESNDWLLAANSGTTLAHRTRGCYYSIDDGQPLFTENLATTP